MADSTKNTKRFMRLQRMLEMLQRQTTELHRLAVAADRRMRAHERSFKQTVIKKRTARKKRA
jgi:predicted GIY-YIG superfamily endonuclease